MFTQQMPAFADALRGAVPPSAIAPLTQSIGNCAQPLSHRGSVNFSGPMRPGQNGAYRGNSTWNPAQYAHLMPGGDARNAPAYQTAVDIGGMSSVWNEGNRYDSRFFFPTYVDFQTDYYNSHYGGPNVHITGGANVDHIYNSYFEGQSAKVSGLTADNINGDPVAGPIGPPGAQGRDGERGVPGAPGGFFNVLPPGFFAPINYLRGRPQIRRNPVLVARPRRYLKDAWVIGDTQVQVPTDAISGATVSVTLSSASLEVPTDAISGGYVSLSPTPVSVTVPLTFSFDAENCAVIVASSTTIYAFPTLPGDQAVSGTPATYDTVTVAATSSPTVTVQTTAASSTSVLAATTAASTLASAAASSGFVIKGLDADFWERNPPQVRVSRDPQIRGINPETTRVYRQ